MNPMWEKAKPYLIGILLALGAGGVAVLLTRGSMSLYMEVRQPPLAPPAFLFPIVWTILYTLMGISSAMVWKACGNRCCSNLLPYVLQLLANVYWTVLFFRLRTYLGSFLWLLVLLALIVWMIRDFAKVSKPAAWLQVPYLLWVTFAGYLNFAIYWLNR